MLSLVVIHDFLKREVNTNPPGTVLTETILSELSWRRCHLSVGTTVITQVCWSDLPTLIAEQPGRAETAYYPDKLANCPEAGRWGWDSLETGGCVRLDQRTLLPIAANLNERRHSKIKGESNQSCSRNRVYRFYVNDTACDFGRP